MGFEQKDAKAAKERIEMKRVRLRCSVFVYLVYFVVVSLSHAQSVPQLINYQGRLADTNNVPVATDEYTLTASLWDAPVAGSNLWSETHVSVPVVRGYFNLILGGVSNGLMNALTSGDTYINVATSNGFQTGRQQLLSVPYAMTVAGGGIGTSSLADGAVTLNKMAQPNMDSATFSLVDWTSQSFVEIDASRVELVTSGRPVMVFVSDGRFTHKSGIGYFNLHMQRMDGSGTNTTIGHVNYYYGSTWGEVCPIFMDHPPAGTNAYYINMRGHPSVHGTHDISGTLVALEL